MKNNEIQFRNMLKSDAAKIADLSDQLGYPATVLEIENNWLNISKSKSDFIFVVTLENHDVVGFAHLGIELGLTHSSRMMLKSFVVDQKYRNQGLGKKFIIFIESEVKGKGFSIIRIGSQVHRAEAHRFYKNSGYDLLKVWNVFEKNIGI